MFRSIKHFYSLSTHDYVMKWLLMSTKETVKVEEEGGKVSEKTVVDFKKGLKMKFLNEIVRIVNKNELDG